MTGPVRVLVAAAASWRAVAAAWMAVVALLALWWLSTSTPELREQLKALQFWSLELCVALVVGAGAFVARRIARTLAVRDVVALGLLGVTAVVLTVLLPPRTNRIFYDELIYQGIGQNLADLKLAQMCNDGTVEYGRLQCWQGEYNKQPYAYPHLLSLAYRVGGVRADTAFVVNLAAMAATVVATAVLAWLLWGSRVTALLAGVVVMLTPHQLMWSATAAVEPTASLACVLVLVVAAHARREPGIASLTALGTMAAWAAQFRPESMLIVVPAGLLVASHLPRLVRQPGAWWAALLTLALMAVPLAHLLVVRDEGWGTTAARLSLDYVAPNFRTNGAFFVADERYPAVYTLLAVVGLVLAKGRAVRVAIAGYFLVFFGIHLAFYAGSYDYGADVRYSLMTYPAVALLAAAGATQLLRRASGGMRVPPGVVAMALAALAFQFSWYAPLIRSTTEEAWAARADVRFAREVAAGLPANAYVLTHNPSMFHVWGVNAGQMSLADSNFVQTAFLAQRYTSRVYLHWNYWCNVADVMQSSLCTRVRDGVHPVLYREYRERDQRLAFFRIEYRPPAPAAVPARPIS